jgi:phage shock protein C
MNRFHDVNRIYKDNVRKKVSGVCAGVAKHWGLEAWIVRLITIGAFLMFPVAIAIAYIVATVMLPSR